MVHEVRGNDGESLLFDGATVAKFRHHGKEEAARNPVSTFREVRVKPATKLFGRPKVPAEYEVLLAMSSIMSLTVPEESKADLDAFVAAVAAAASA